MNRAAAIVVAAALVVSACSAADPVKDTSTSTQAPASSVAAGDTTETTTETTSGTTEPTVEPDGRRIVVVVDEIRAVALAETAAQFTTDMGVEVVFDIRPLSEIRARAGDPDVDIFMGPHTWQTELDSKAATRPIEGVDDIWSNQALDAFRLSAGVMAAVPFSAESLVMFRNTDLLAAAPLDLSDGCGDIPQSCVVMPGLGAGGGYHMTPFLMGGAVNDLDSAFETPDPGALEASGDLIDAGTLELMSITAARQAFIAGSAAMFIGGPWDLGPIEDAGIGFAVDPLPSAAGFNLRAPTSVLGFYLASASPQSDAATTFLVDYLADASAQRALYLRDRRAPVHSALDDLGDTARALAAGVNDGFLLPQGDLAVYWKELGLALEEIVGGVDPATGHGRVVFYDYDELGRITDCRFRPIPESDNPADDMADTPWFSVGEGDVFPEELPRFMGLAPDLTALFREHHSDLFDHRTWVGVQQRLAAGERIEIFPYGPELRIPH